MFFSDKPITLKNMNKISYQIENPTKCKRLQTSQKTFLFDDWLVSVACSLFKLNVLTKISNYDNSHSRAKSVYNAEESIVLILTDCYLQSLEPTSPLFSVYTLIS